MAGNWARFVQTGCQMQPTAPACFLLELAQFWTICLSPVGLLCAPICLVHSGLVLSQLAYRFGPGNPCLPLPSWPANCLLVHSLPSSSVGQPDACWCTNCPDCGATSLSTHQSGPLDLHCPEISLFPRSLHMEGTYLLRRKFWIFGRKLGRCYILLHLIRATSSLPVCEHMVLLVPQS